MQHFGERGKRTGELKPIFPLDDPKNREKILNMVKENRREGMTALKRAGHPIVDNGDLSPIQVISDSIEVVYEHGIGKFIIEGHNISKHLKSAEVGIHIDSWPIVTLHFRPRASMILINDEGEPEDEYAVNIEDAKTKDDLRLAAILHFRKTGHSLQCISDANKIRIFADPVQILYDGDTLQVTLGQHDISTLITAAGVQFNAGVAPTISFRPKLNGLPGR